MKSKHGLAAVPRGVWVLGLVSMCMDLSSELIHSLLPLYLAVGLGASTLTIGIIEGVAEAIALIVKVFSGVLSDLFHRRKALVVLGYGLAAVTKPVFPLASTLGWVVTARFVDRVGKGIRGAPRDALITDITPPEVRGASFGLRQALDTVGAVGGPLLAIAAIAMFAGDFKAAFWVAVIPAFLSVALLVGGGRRTGPTAVVCGARTRTDACGLPTRSVSAAVSPSSSPLPRCSRSRGFPRPSSILRARDVGLAVGHAPWVMVVMSAIYAAVAYPAGAAADRGYGPKLLSAGLIALVASDLLLARAAGPTGGDDRRGVVGIAHGADAGTSGRARRAGRAGGLARHGVRRVQSRVRRSAARGERDRRLAVGRLRAAIHVLRGRGVHAGRVGRVPRLWAQRNEAAALRRPAPSA